jgi:hypothetical protein
MDGLTRPNDISESGSKRDQPMLNKTFGDEAPEERHTNHPVDDDVVETGLPRELRLQVQGVQVPGGLRITS